MKTKFLGKMMTLIFMATGRTHRESKIQARLHFQSQRKKSSINNPLQRATDQLVGIHLKSKISAISFPILVTTKITEMKKWCQ